MKSAKTIKILVVVCQSKITLNEILLRTNSHYLIFYSFCSRMLCALEEGMESRVQDFYNVNQTLYTYLMYPICTYVIGILLQSQCKRKLIDNWSNKTDILRHRTQRTAGEVLEMVT